MAGRKVKLPGNLRLTSNTSKNLLTNLMKTIKTNLNKLLKRLKLKLRQPRKRRRSFSRKAKPRQINLGKRKPKRLGAEIRRKMTKKKFLLLKVLLL